MSTTWQLTAGEMISQAMTEIGALTSGETPTSPETQDALKRLNGMLNMWAGESNLFREGESTVTVTGGTGVATLPQDVREVHGVWHAVNSTYDRPLVEWNRNEYYQLPNRSTVGNPSAYYTRRTTSAIELHIWPVPAAAVTLKLDYSRMPTTVDNVDAIVDIPQEWQEAAVYGLASRIAAMFGTTRIDPGVVQRTDSLANALYQRLLDRDRPDSIYMLPYDSYY